jgi:hypothetical protein
MSYQHQPGRIRIQAVHQKTIPFALNLNPPQQAAVIPPLGSLSQHAMRLKPHGIPAHIFNQRGFFRLPAQHNLVIKQLQARASLNLSLCLAQANLFALVSPPTGTLGHGILNALLWQASGITQCVNRCLGVLNSKVGSGSHRISAE